MHQKTVKVLMIQSLGYIDQAGGDGSRVRIDAARKLVREGVIPNNAIMVWPQGYAPGSEEEESLGENLAKYCRKLSGFAGMRILNEPLGWGTINDIQNAYLMIKKEEYVRAHFYFVSDPQHMRRIRLVWNKTHPPGWTAEFHTSGYVLAWWEGTLREWVAYAVYWLKLTFRRE